ncbi:MAG: hypothetical protein FJ096_20295 [Deltaproteobacteria bacterium]|nr:hypothetical protein [Deltaproteobacteria bacterium]
MTDSLPPPPDTTARRGGCRKILLVLLVLASLVGGVGAFLYFRYVRPTPRAHRHLPRGANIALRADAVELLMFKPVRERLLPLLGGSGEGKAPNPILKRLDELTGVKLPTDLREIVVGSVDGAQWVMALGGTIEAGRFVDGLEVVLKEAGSAGWTRDGVVLVHSTGGALGQAEDGTLVAGTSRSVVLAALTARDEDPPPEELPLPTTGAVTFMMNSRAYRGALTHLPSILSPVDTLESIDRMNGVLLLSEAPRVEVQLRPRGVPAAELVGKLESQLSAVKLVLLLSSDDLGGAKRAIASAQVSEKNGDVLVSAPWPYDALEDGVANLANLVGLALAHGPFLK